MSLKSSNISTSKKERIEIKLEITLTKPWKKSFCKTKYLSSKENWS